MAGAAQGASADLVIRNAMVYDGSARRRTAPRWPSAAIASPTPARSAARARGASSMPAGMPWRMAEGQGDIKYPVTWNTLGGYLETLERRGIAPNVASFVGAPAARIVVLTSWCSTPPP